MICQHYYYTKSIFLTSSIRLNFFQFLFYCEVLKFWSSQTFGSKCTYKVSWLLIRLHFTFSSISASSIHQFGSFIELSISFLFLRSVLSYASIFSLIYFHHLVALRYASVLFRYETQDLRLQISRVTCVTNSQEQVVRVAQERQACWSSYFAVPKKLDISSIEQLPSADSMTCGKEKDTRDKTRRDRNVSKRLKRRESWLQC